MVAFTTVTECNVRAASDEPSVCVFAGATSGIGAGTLTRVAELRPNSTIYVIGRSAARFANGQQRDLVQSIKSRNGTGQVIFLEAEFSLLAQVDDVCRQVASRESRVDWLYMSPGMLPFNGANCMALGSIRSPEFLDNSYSQIPPRDLRCVFPSRITRACDCSPTSSHF